MKGLARTCSTYELGQQAGKRLAAVMLPRQDTETTAIEWYRGFVRGLGIDGSRDEESFIVQRCREAIGRRKGA